MGGRYASQQSLIHILAGMKFTTLITPASGCNARPRPRYALMHRRPRDARLHDLPTSSVRQAETISSIWVKLRPLFACDCFVGVCARASARNCTQPAKRKSSRRRWKSSGANLTP